jgi:transcriptional regulator GlxA family with amidase domain
MQIALVLYSKFTLLGAHYLPERVVERGKVITAAGVSSGIDMALRLVEQMHGVEMAELVQLGIEYDPQPPFDAGSPAKAPPELVELAEVRLADQLSDEALKALVQQAGSAR